MPDIYSMKLVCRQVDEVVMRRPTAFHEYYVPVEVVHDLMLDTIVPHGYSHYNFPVEAVRDETFASVLRVFSVER